MTVHDIARSILAGEIPVAGRVIAVRDIQRVVTPTPARGFMMCQQPLEDGPRPRRCLALTVPGRGFCQDHPFSGQIVTGG